MANLAEVLGNALSLEVRDRAALAEKLLEVWRSSPRRKRIACGRRRRKDAWRSIAQVVLKRFRRMRYTRRRNDSSGDANQVPRGGRG